MRLRLGWTQLFQLSQYFVNPRLKAGACFLQVFGKKKPFESILLHCNFLNFYAQLLLIRALCQFIDRRHFEARKFPTVNWLNLLNFSQHNLATCKSQKNHFFFKFIFYTTGKLLKVFINDKNKNKLKVTSQVFLSCVTDLHYNYIFTHFFFPMLVSAQY